MARTVQQLIFSSGKTALVTGGSRGLGLQMQYAGAGEAGAHHAQLAQAEDLEQAVAELQAAGNFDALDRRRLASA